MNSLIKILSLLLITCSFACSSQTPARKTNLTSSELREDYEIFRRALEEAHPALYQYTSKAEFKTAFEQTDVILDRNLTKQEFFKELTPLITKIRCGHVKFMPGGEEPYKYPFHENKLLPLKLLITKDGAFVHKTYGISNIPPGSKILKIDNREMTNILEGLLQYVTFADGTATASKYVELSTYFSGYYAAFIDTRNSYTVSYLTMDGSTGQTELPAVEYSLLNMENEKHLMEESKELLSLDITGETAIMKISTFMFEDKSVNFEGFLNDAFSKIKEKDVKSLIIDLRDNEGGKDSYGALLYSYLTDNPFPYYKRVTTNTNKKFSFSAHAKHPWYFYFYRQLLKKADDGVYLWKRHDNLKLQNPQAEPFLGELYILINGRSFSVTSEFAAIAYSNKRGIFVGQETAGGYLGNNSGFFSIVSLPNSGFVLGIPLWHYEMAVDQKLLKKGGVIPHYPIEPKIEDVLKGIDGEMEKVKELAAKNNEMLAKSDL